ncbi:MAG: glycoside hydrolase family 127 protein [Chloroflexi bacterium]|nr:glycoside hydrolase family 127 protein [Chloroflexota bacterium]
MEQQVRKALPTLDRAADARFHFGGVVGERIQANERNWLLVAPDANPAVLEMFRDRDRKPVRDLLRWSGEFAGKYLTSAVQGYRLTGHEDLRAYLDRFVRDLIDTQTEDGYLGAFPRSYRLTGWTIAPDGTEFQTWDAWNHYHIMLGLLLWHEETGDEPALAACCRAADLFCRTFLDTGHRLAFIGFSEMNLSPIHVLCLLHERTGIARYLQMARAIEQDFEDPAANDYVRAALAGREFFEAPKPRWESLHTIQGIAELYFITGADQYRRAYEHIWRSILRGDRHNTGGFSSGEQAVGNPYDPRPIETCCTVAWMALSVDMLRMTGLSTVADELELSTLNAVLGSQSLTGRWCTYDTPMDGVRTASAHTLWGQARPGSPELNCCSVNGPRALGMLSEWAIMRAPADGAVAINYYGPGFHEVNLPAGSTVRLIQETDYPVRGDIHLRVEPEHPERFRLLLRIPEWSRQTTVTLNGQAESEVRPGSYLELEREWRRGDTVELSLDMSPRLWIGEREAEGKVSVYRGPVLLAYDPRFNAVDPDDLPRLGPRNLTGTLATPRGRPAPILTVKLATEGRDLYLCDFASAGAAGNPYVTWLPMLDRERIAPASPAGAAG